MAKIDRSTDGLRSVLFEELESLRAGRTTPQKASAVARLAAGIVSSTKLDLEYQRFAKAVEGDDAPKIACVPSLKLIHRAA